MRLVPSPICWGLQVVQGLRVVPVFLYRYSMKISLKKARSPGTRRGQIRLGAVSILLSAFFPLLVFARVNQTIETLVMWKAFIVFPFLVFFV